MLAALVVHRTARFLLDRIYTGKKGGKGKPVRHDGPIWSGAERERSLRYDDVPRIQEAC